MTDYLFLIFIFLSAGVIAVPIASRFKLGSVLGYLIAGIAISPLLALLDVDVTSLQHFAEFGVVMMLFLVGLELEPRLLWQMRARLLGLGGLQIALTTGVVMGAAMLLGIGWSVALAIGLVLSLSSTAIVLQTLNEKGLMKSDGGQSSFSVLLFQDIAVIPMLALLPLLALPGMLDIGSGAGHEAAADHATSLSLVQGLNGWQTALATIAAIAVVVVGGSRLTSPLFRFIASARLRELFTATALLIVIGIALLMSLVGLSPALGTFLAGVVLANSEYRHELESDIDPFKGLLLGLFFMTVGAGIDFQLLLDNIGPIITLTLGLIVAKVGVLLTLGHLFGVKGADRWLLALGLAQAGEFGFVLLSFTVGIAVIPAAIADQLLLIVALSMLLTPLLFIIHDRVIAPRFDSKEWREADKIEKKCKVIIAGHGRVGGIANRMLRGSGFETTVIDYSSSQLEMLRAYNVKVYYGDATRPDLLHAAGIDEARVFIIAIDDKEHITALTEYAVSTYPHLHVIARAVDRDHVYDLYAAGCRDIIRETFDSSLRLGRSALEALGVTHEVAMQVTREFETLDKRFILEMAQLYRRGTPNHLNPAYAAKVIELNAEWAQQLRMKKAKAEETLANAPNSSLAPESMQCSDVESRG
jgi:CPA2 family monovalent cation:H+ antiporter-2